ncbi:MAG: hypothetical protein AAGJ18_05105 [Bacteroidota bacterium]
MNRTNTKIIGLSLILQLFVFTPVYPQVPVADYFGRWLSKTSSVVQQASQFIKETAAPLVNTFKKTQEFFQKAQTFVSRVVTNLRYIERIMETHGDIRVLFDKAITGLNAPRDLDDNGEDDWSGDLDDTLDKWKHAQVLLAISAEATSVFEIFSNMIEDDAFTIDDKGRVQIIKETYLEMLGLKRAMRAQLRRINREVYQYSRLKKQVQIFDALFSTK